MKNKPLMIGLIVLVILCLVGAALWIMNANKAVSKTIPFHYFPVGDLTVAPKPPTQTIDHYHYSCDNKATSSVTVYLSSGDSVVATGMSMGDLSAFLQILSQKDVHYNTRLQLFTNF